MEYTAKEEIGRGGFGIVELVEDEAGNEFACKTLNYGNLSSTEREQLKKRFEREVRYQLSIKHENIVPILDSNLDDDPPWFIMPLADETLEEAFRKDITLGKEPNKALFDILAGLQVLHEKGFTHRDLKPGNILIFNTAGGDKVYKISDFGLTTPGIGNTSTLTQSNMGGGTINYRAPECATNFRRATAAADVYSFGAILYDIFSSGLSRTPHVQLNLPGPMEAIIEKCTHTRPRRRYSDITKLRADLFDVLDKVEIKPFSKAEENIIRILQSEASLTDEEWDRVFHLLDENSDKGVSNENIFRALSQEHIVQLHEDAPDMFNGLGEMFCEFMDEGGFNFDYCDVIADKAQQFYDLGTIELKAKTTLRVLTLGTSHNRWYVERKFIAMAGQEITDTLANRIKIEIEVTDFPFQYRIEHLERSIAKDRSDLHEVLREMLN